MNISLISFLTALIVITLLVTALLKQKAKPARKEYKPHNTDSYNSGSEPSFSASLVTSKWAEIQAMMNSGPSGLKAALFEADKLLDYCMIGKGFAGETMGERLKSSGARFNNLNSVWNAHKLRNQLAHEVSHDMVANQVKQAINDLGNAIRDLGVRL
jgi:hypothetical protein